MRIPGSLKFFLGGGKSKQIFFFNKKFFEWSGIDYFFFADSQVTLLTLYQKLLVVVNSITVFIHSVFSASIY